MDTIFSLDSLGSHKTLQICQHIYAWMLVNPRPTFWSLQIPAWRAESTHFFDHPLFLVFSIMRPFCVKDSLPLSEFWAQGSLHTWSINNVPGLWQVKNKCSSFGHETMSQISSGWWYDVDVILLSSSLYSSKYTAFSFAPTVPAKNILFSVLLVTGAKHLAYNIIMLNSNSKVIVISKVLDALSRIRSSFQTCFMVVVMKERNVYVLRAKGRVWGELRWY